MKARAYLQFESAVLSLCHYVGHSNISRMLQKYSIEVMFACRRKKRQSFMLSKKTDLLDLKSDHYGIREIQQFYKRYRAYNIFLSAVLKHPSLFHVANLHINLNPTFSTPPSLFTNVCSFIYGPNEISKLFFFC